MSHVTLLFCKTTTVLLLRFLGLNSSHRLRFHRPLCQFNSLLMPEEADTYIALDLGLFWSPRCHPRKQNKTKQKV